MNKDYSLILVLPNELLEKFFQFFDLGDLKVCRNVCKRWFQVANSFLQIELRKNGGIVFEPDLKVNLQNGENAFSSKDCRLSKLPAYLDYLKSGCGFPIPNLIFQNILMEGECVFQLFQYFGSTIVNLEIQITHPFQAISSNSFKNLVIKSCPNLRALSISCTAPTVDFIPEGLFTSQEIENNEFKMYLTRIIEIKLEIAKGRKFIQDLLLICPNLQTVSYIYPDTGRTWFAATNRRESQEMKEMNEHFILSLLKNNLVNLKSLDFELLTSNSLNLLKDSSTWLKLEDLSISKIDMSLSHDIIQTAEELLLSQAENLINLKLFTFPLFPLPRERLFSLPTFPKLSSFFIELKKSFMPKFSQINLATVCPSLIELTLEGKDEENLMELLGLNDGPHLKLRKLVLVQCKVNGEIIERLGTVFPNLKVLHANEQLFCVCQKIWTLWPKLKELKIKPIIEECKSIGNEDLEKKIDSLFTGFTIGQINSGAIFDNKEKPKNPSISNLKGLQRLEIMTPHFNDFILNHELMKMTELRYVLIGISGDSKNIEVSEDAVVELAKKLGLFWSRKKQNCLSAEVGFEWKSYTSHN